MRIPTDTIAITVVVCSVIVTSSKAWAPTSLFRLGRRQHLIKHPIPTRIEMMAQQRQSLSSTARFAKVEENQESRTDIPSEAPTYVREGDFNYAEEELLSSSASLEEGGNNLKVPQIHLPPRISNPGVGWEHHHRATTQFVHGHLSRMKANEDDPTKLLVSNADEWRILEEHKEEIDETHLRDLLQDADRSGAMYAEHDGVYLDFSRQRATLETLDLLEDLAEEQELTKKIKAMMSGEKINFTEKRAVLHTALRADRTEQVYVDGQNVIEEVHEVLDQIKGFTEGVRSGSIRGYTGKRLRNIISVGIGGSYLGPEFLHEVLKTEPEGINSALGYSLRFLANVDPVDVERTCADLDPEETLIVIVSKTFTTAETMLNARTMRQWLWDFMGNDKEVVRKHIVACASTSATEKVKDFGIDTDKYFFRFWDWVGGRYSVCSAAGALPISLLYGFPLFEKFLKVSKPLNGECESRSRCLTHVTIEYRQ